MLGLNTSDEVELDYIVSSLGSVNHDLVTALYYGEAGQGQEGQGDFR
jgi:hypothetical protein